MKTCPRFHYSQFAMKQEYWQGFNGIEMPVDFQSIDAPTTLCTGSHYSYTTKNGHGMSLVSLTVREGTLS